MQFSSSKYLENARLKALIRGKNDLTNFFSNFTEQQIHDRKEREQQLKDYEKAVAQELVCEKIWLKAGPFKKLGSQVTKMSRSFDTFNHFLKGPKKILIAVPLNVPLSI